MSTIVIDEAPINNILNRYNAWNDCTLTDISDAEKKVFRIVNNLRQRNSFRDIWDELYDVVKGEILINWLHIINGEDVDVNLALNIMKVYNK